MIFVFSFISEFIKTLIARYRKYIWIPEKIKVTSNYSKFEIMLTHPLQTSLCVVRAFLLLNVALHVEQVNLKTLRCFLLICLPRFPDWISMLQYGQGLSLRDTFSWVWCVSSGYDINDSGDFSGIFGFSFIF